MPREDPERVADLLCDRHFDLIVGSGVWPRGWSVHSSCLDCGSGRFDLLPHLDLDWQLAVHEAGHAVCFVVTGSGVELVTSRRGDVPAGAAAGGVNFTTEKGSYDAAALFGGAAAVRFWAESQQPVGDTDVVDVVFGASHDFVAAYEAGLSDAEVDESFTKAEDLVEDFWPSIERAAAALVTRGRLTGAEFLGVAGLEARAGRR